MDSSFRWNDEFDKNGGMSRDKLRSVIENAISKADNSYFNENYTKQALAVLAALDAAGFAVLPKELPEATWEQAANEMKTGRVKPAEHVKDVYQTVLRIAAVKAS